MSDDLVARIGAEIDAAGGWIGFERYMALALYEPGLGYYASGGRKFGALPSSGSDFVTAPELSCAFGHTLARQVAQALEAGGCDAVWEFGAGSGALARQLLAALGARVRCYTIVDLSGALRERQRKALAAFEGKVQWVDRLPDRIEGVVVGNEVLDAMPVALLHWDGERWLERGVARARGSAGGVRQAGAAHAGPHGTASAAPGGTASVAPGGPAGATPAGTARAPGGGLPPFVFADRPTALRPPADVDFVPGTVTELHRHATAFIATLAERLRRGAAFFVDYGFPEAEYYHPQRTGGTLMCHRAHRADTDPLSDVGDKDITAHVDFTAIALAGQDAGLEVLGYTSQARFLLNCGITDLLAGADLRTLAAAQKLLAEHEMGELFKVIGFGTPDVRFDPIGFASGDRTHRL